MEPRLLRVTTGPFNSPDDLVRALKEALALLDNNSEQDVAYSMASQIISAKHDDWWKGSHATQPAIAKVSEIVLHLETNDGSPEQRQKEWDQVRQLLK